MPSGDAIGYRWSAVQGMATTEHGRRMFIWLTFLYLIQFLTIFTIVYQMIVIRKLRRQRDDVMGQSIGAVMLAAAFIERDVKVPCDDCGNMMDKGDAIDVLERPDGGTYMGHRSHGRRIDWGG